MRLKRPPIDRPACHLKPKALPSAGFFPFLQTFVCGINNECYEYPPEADRESSLSGDFINAYISLFADDDFTVSSNPSDVAVRSKFLKNFAFKVELNRA